jgi:hypothetical protein
MLIIRPLVPEVKTQAPEVGEDSLHIPYMHIFQTTLFTQNNNYVQV